MRFHNDGPGNTTKKNVRIVFETDEAESVLSYRAVLSVNHENEDGYVA
jgi:hypothetical protein